MLTIPILVFLIVLAPLAVGSVYIVTYSAAEFVIFSLLAVNIARSFIVNPRLSPVSGIPATSLQPQASAPGLFLPLLPLLIFLVFVLFQMIPLPASLLRSVSPNTYGLYEKLGLLSRYMPLSLSIHGTSVGFLKWAACGALFFIVASYRPAAPILEGQGWITILVVSVIFIGLVEALYGLYGYVNDPGALLWFTRTHGHYGHRVAGTYINPNHLAGLMNMTLPLTVAFFVFYAGSIRRGRHRADNLFIELATSKKAVLSYVLLFSIILMVLALIFSGSRMGQFSFLAAMAGTAILSAIRLAGKGQKRISAPLLLIVIGCISIGVLWGAWKGLDPVIERWGTADQAIMQSRGILWETTRPLVNDFPLTGTGLGTYELAYRSYQPESLGTAVYDHAHNDYLQVLAETGWIGFVLWLAFFVIFLARVIVRWVRNQDPYAVAIGAGGIAATMAILVHSFGEFNLQIPANALLLFIIMAITWRSV